MSIDVPPSKKEKSSTGEQEEEKMNLAKGGSHTAREKVEKKACNVARVSKRVPKVALLHSFGHFSHMVEHRQIVSTDVCTCGPDRGREITSVVKKSCFLPLTPLQQ